MALTKNNLNINFAQGLDTKTDPFQVTPGRFLSLKNSVFSKAGLLQKRNGFANLTALPDATSSLVTTFNGNLTAAGSSLYAYSQGSQSWLNKGALKPVSLTTLAAIRSSTNQAYVDSASTSALTCVAYEDVINAGSSTISYNYAVIDSTTGQNIIAPTSLGSVNKGPKVFVLGNYFIVLWADGSGNLKYISININTLVVSSAATIDTSSNAARLQGIVVGSRLFLLYRKSSDAVTTGRMLYLDKSLALSSSVLITGLAGSWQDSSLCLDASANVIYGTVCHISGSTACSTFVVDTNLNTVLAATSMTAPGNTAHVTSFAANGVCTVLYEIIGAYGYDAALATNYIAKATITQAGSVSASSTVVRSLGLASQAFQVNNTAYFLGVYGDPSSQAAQSYQPSYFLCDSGGSVVAKLAYSNAGPYLSNSLPNVSVIGTTATVPYLVKDLVQAVNKTQGVASSSGIYSQTGINLATFNFSPTNVATGEIGQNLNITGGFLWSYDGYTPVEQGFHLWPEFVEATWSATGGSMAAQPNGSTNTNAYFYQVTYEWADNQGNVFRSAPSVPLAVTTTGVATTGSVTLNIPTLRLTYKTNVKIVIYRWSVAQQTYYQTTSITSPLLNDPTVDSVSYVDTNADASIIGNNILYVTGGVLENIAAPASDIMTLWQSRLFLVDAEDRNLLWYSKQVIESTPVEMSDLQTIYVAPTIGAQGSTGPITALSAQDDKLIIFKKDAIYYVAGSGPDITGANNQYSDPVFITATVGCANPKSIVYMPQGLMFQSDKGIWLLGRDISTQYIGAAVEGLTQNATVLSAVNVPGTNQVRFTLDSGITLMYDYYYNQWGTFTNVPAISSTLYEGLHTYLDSSGHVRQETPGAYLDGANPVLMSFTTSWLNLAGLQGYERAYFFYLLGSYLSPHKLSIQIAYDYNSSPQQFVLISPDNYSSNYGGDTLWGGSPSWGGQASLEQWRIFFNKQKCQAFQITLNEVFDPSLASKAGAGLTISGLDIIVGAKSTYPRIRAARSTG